MLLIFALTVGALMATGLYIMLRRSFVRLVVGLSLLTYGANLFLFSMGDLSKRGLPIVDMGSPETMADPLPSALILTAIVISFGVMAFTLTLAYRASQVARGDDLDALVDREWEE
ncbi:MAG TPA: NADH-quinone oxidoreductase subunit K [Aggregatilineales bacterium]|nr:NADH-quinone oxidoreductase subunit K [Anaerolineales bacterium]HRE46677.1 NADH-quinone oxidoreductase subunit K [Aggregatilineales bacterium]